MGIDNNRQRFSTLVEAVRGHSVERCLPYPGMADVPEGFPRLAQEDSQAHQCCWDDTCPVYALALLTYGGYRLPEDDESLETLWDELGGESTKLWPDVSKTLQRGWKWLAERDADRRAG